MATIEGSLSKWTNVMKGWQYRWFVLDKNTGLLSYYTSKEKMIRGVRRGCVRLKGAVIGIDDEDENTFTITVDSKTFHFQARDAEEREKWVRCLEETIMRHTYGYKSPSSLRLDVVKQSPTMADFDKKLAEADAYLQILIDQTQSLEIRMEQLTDVDDKNRLDIIIHHTNEMLEQVKHSIVLLQIAKNTAFPVNGSFQPSASCVALCSDMSALSMKSTETNQQRTNLSPPAVVPVIPATSYSSSEEEDFYDAHDTSCERSSNAPSSTPPSPKINQDIACFVVEQAIAVEVETPPQQPLPKITIPTKFLKINGTLDYDAMYEDTSENEISVEIHGSVVSHLLSQVKIGMDLTKVALPTFILERRSLLEMYADYFAHPDMFIKIAELQTPQERIIQVVRWYLCSYHAGRKSSVAKKPYNPILGEVFQCYWSVDKEDIIPQSPLVSDGPVPWCDRDQLTFVAEQVSHHPPISAFYAEHYNKKISFDAHIWTRSKFLGLSIGVNNIGSGTVNVIEHNEKYTVTFPNGYGRSILTVPWIELGGSVKIICEKTGYYANVEFITKPFYGGKKHRITTDVFSPNEKKPFLMILGEWNGQLEAKWADGRVEEFANVVELPVVKKIVRPIEKQKENESRKLWKEVTAGLRLNDVEYASKAKTAIEERQRMEAQQRKDSGVSWETRLFSKSGDEWYFNKPLSNRIFK